MIPHNAAGLLKICSLLHEKNFIASADGNISIRLQDGNILMTPSGAHKGFLQESDFAIVTLDNKIVNGNPSSERLMHLEIYNHCPKAMAVVHAHPPMAIAWSVAKPQLPELPLEALSELILAVGKVPIVPYALPGTSAMASHLTPYLPQSRALILARHGAVAWGEDLLEAYSGIERIEHAARILKYATELGGITELPSTEIEQLWELRKKIGERIK